MRGLVFMVRPIRRDLLIHEVMYQEKGEDSMWGSGELKEAVPVRYVRLEPKTRVVASGEGNQVESDTTLFWDATFSTPVTWKEESKVTWNGKEKTVVGVDLYYDRSRLHHAEVRLI